MPLSSLHWVRALELLAVFIVPDLRAWGEQDCTLCCVGTQDGQPTVPIVYRWADKNRLLIKGLYSMCRSVSGDLQLGHSLLLRREPFTEQASPLDCVHNLYAYRDCKIIVRQFLCQQTLPCW